MARAGVKEFAVLDPTSGPLDRAEKRKIAPRLATLDGAVVGLLANGLHQTEALFDALYTELSKQYELAGAVRVLKRGVAVPPDKDDELRLKDQAAVVITGFGG